MEVQRGISSAESAVVHLQMLLHYHERVMMFPMHGCKSEIDGRCAREIMSDVYADALREAIRCVKIVNQLPEDL